VGIRAFKLSLWSYQDTEAAKIALNLVKASLSARLSADNNRCCTQKQSGLAFF